MDQLSTWYKSALESLTLSTLSSSDDITEADEAASPSTYPFLPFSLKSPTTTTSNDHEMASQSEQEPNVSTSTISTPPTLSQTNHPITVPHTIHIGTRKSSLALKQTSIVLTLLNHYSPQHNYETTSLTTLGDKDKVTALPDFGAKSLWTFELEAMLLDGSLDFIVHSLKDMPTQLPPTCTIGAILPRGDPRDALILSPRIHPPHLSPKDIPTLSSLPEGSVIGTSSVRRSAQLKRLYPHLSFDSVRGNVPTRLRKLDAEDSPFAGIVLAAAGLIRLGLGDRVSGFLESKNVEGVHKDLFHPTLQKEENHIASEAAGYIGGQDRLDDVAPVSAEDSAHSTTKEIPDDLQERQRSLGDKRWGMLHAVGQGAIGIEIRENDERTKQLLEPLRCVRTTLACLAERSLMRTLEGGCSVPIGVETEWESPSTDVQTEGATAVEEIPQKTEKGGVLTMKAIVVSVAGDRAAEAELSREIMTDEQADEFGREVARVLVERGADEILGEINLDRGVLKDQADNA